jgi:CPA2 family monovalent cation:H+ antiporter-2
MGFALSVASTVVLLRALEERKQVKGDVGKIAMGWLIVEDLVIVIALVVLPLLVVQPGTEVNGGALAASMGWTLFKVAAFTAVMLVVGAKVLPWVLVRIAHTKSRELFTLGVLAIALGIAWVAYALFHSFAMGAFLAGLVLNSSPLGHNAAERSLPLRDAFAVLFFVSVGMLFDWHILVERPLSVLGVLAIIIVGKSLAALVITTAFKLDKATSLTVAAALAQIGEFSFILAALGMSLGLLPELGQNLILAGAIISIALNPVVFRLTKPIERWLTRDGTVESRFERTADPLAELPMSVPHEHLDGQVVLVGYGRVGRRIAEVLVKHGIPFVVAEQNREIVDQLRKDGIHAVAGNAGEPAVLIQAHIARAGMLVIATPDTFHVRAMVETARLLNPNIKTVVRTHGDEEAELLRSELAGKIFMGEEELAKGMTEFVVANFERNSSGH